MVMTGAIFGSFETYFGYQNLNVDINTSKGGMKLHLNRLSGIKYFDFVIFINFDRFWPSWAKNCAFLQKCDLRKIIKNVIPVARNELQSWKLASWCRKILQKTYRKGNFDFWNLLYFIAFSRKNWAKKFGPKKLSK